MLPSTPRTMPRLGGVVGGAAEQPLGLLPGAGRGPEVDQDDLGADVAREVDVLADDLDAAVPLAERAG